MNLILSSEEYRITVNRRYHINFRVLHVKYNELNAKNH